MFGDVGLTCALSFSVKSAPLMLQRNILKVRLSCPRLLRRRSGRRDVWLRAAMSLLLLLVLLMSLLVLRGLLWRKFVKRML